MNEKLNIFNLIFFLLIFCILSFLAGILHQNITTQAQIQKAISTSQSVEIGRYTIKIIPQHPTPELKDLTIAGMAGEGRLLNPE